MRPRRSAEAFALIALVFGGSLEAAGQPLKPDFEFCEDPSAYCRLTQMDPECDSAVDSAAASRADAGRCIASAERYVRCLAPVAVICIEEKRQVSFRCTAEKSEGWDEDLLKSFGDALDFTLFDGRKVHSWDLDVAMSGQVTEDAVRASANKNGIRYLLELDRTSLRFSFRADTKPHYFTIEGLCRPIPRRVATRANAF